LGEILVIRRELLEKILKDSKYGKKLEETLNELFQGKKKVKHLRKIVEQYCKEHNLRMQELNL